MLDQMAAIAPTTITIQTTGQGLYEFTTAVGDAVADASVNHAVATVFVRHTSCSLIIQENADPSARRDLEQWLSRLVPEDDPWYTHTAEGPDDMPAHIKSVVTQVSLSIPIISGELALGTWQGIYLWEHRRAAHTRQIVVAITS